MVEFPLLGPLEVPFSAAAVTVAFAGFGVDVVALVVVLLPL
jgi:hypothetical protein